MNNYEKYKIKGSDTIEPQLDWMGNEFLSRFVTHRFPHIDNNVICEYMGDPNFLPGNTIITNSHIVINEFLEEAHRRGDL